MKARYDFTRGERGPVLKGRSVLERRGRWQLHDAKARFSEVVRRAKHEGPQHVTVHGREEVVVVGADDFRRLAGDQTGQVLVDAMQLSPHRSTTVEPSRLRMPVRDVDL